MHISDMGYSDMDDSAVDESDLDCSAVDAPEVRVGTKRRKPPGYEFVPKGNAFRTRLCRKLTHAAGKALYVVKNGRRLKGLWAPQQILAEVDRRDRETRGTRAAAVEKRDAKRREEFRDAILAEFPQIPDKSLKAVLHRSLKKGQGRVGRTSTLEMHNKVHLAVSAHARHAHTEYESLLKTFHLPRARARNQIQQGVCRILREWRAPTRQKQISDDRETMRKRRKRNRRRRQVVQQQYSLGVARGSIPVTKARAKAAARRMREQRGSVAQRTQIS